VPWDIANCGLKPSTCSALLCAYEHQACTPQDYQHWLGGVQEYVPEISLQRAAVRVACRHLLAASWQVSTYLSDMWLHGRCTCWCQKVPPSACMCSICFEPCWQASTHGTCLSADVEKGSGNRRLAGSSRLTATPCLTEMWQVLPASTPTPTSSAAPGATASTAALCGILWQLP
jgi:hypothetical protein